MRHLVRLLASAVLATGLSACDAVAPRADDAATIRGTRISAPSLTPGPTSALVRHTSGDAVVLEGDRADFFDAYFQLDLGPEGATLTLDLHERGRDAPVVRAVQRKRAEGRFAVDLWAPTAGGLIVEAVGDDGSTTTVSHDGDGPLGETSEEFDSFHYERDEDGNTYIVYDFSDGAPADVVLAGAGAPVPCRELRVRPAGRSWAVDHPVGTLDGEGWSTARFVGPPAL